MKTNNSGVDMLKTFGMLQKNIGSSANLAQKKVKNKK